MGTVPGVQVQRGVMSRVTDALGSVRPYNKTTAPNVFAKTQDALGFPKVPPTDKGLEYPSHG